MYFFILKEGAVHIVTRMIYIYTVMVYIYPCCINCYIIPTVIDERLSSYKAELLLLLFVCDWKLIEPRKHIFSGKSLLYFHLESKYECFAPTGFL